MRVRVNDRVTVRMRAGLRVRQRRTTRVTVRIKDKVRVRPAESTNRISRLGCPTIRANAEPKQPSVPLPVSLLITHTCTNNCCTGIT